MNRLWTPGRIGTFVQWACRAALALAVAGQLTAAGRAAESRGAKYALLVGVAQYAKSDELRTLAYSQRDVTDLAQALRDNGYDADDVALMTQAAGAANPTKKNILEALGRLLADRTAGDTVLVAFAGHGVKFKDDDASYFCPADARLDDKASLLSLTEVYQEMEHCPAGLKVLLVDACRNDPFSETTRSVRMNLQSVTRPQAAQDGGVIAFFSCSEKEKAFESDKLKHGVFFHYVIEGLKGEAAGDRDDVSVLGLGEYVSRHVADFVKAEYGRSQTPELAGKSRGTALLVDPTEGMKARRRGKRCLERKEYDEAVEELTTALRSGTPAAVVYRDRAEAYLWSGMYEEAVADCDAAVRLDPKYAPAYALRGFVRDQKEDFDKALEDCEAAIRLDATYAPAYAFRGFLYRDKKHDYDGGLTECDKALRLDPAFALGFALRANLYAGHGDLDKALDDCNAALRLDPKLALAYAFRGDIYDRKGDLDRALSDCGEAARLDPKLVEAHDFRAGIYSEKKELTKALSEADETVRLAPRAPVGYMSRSTVYLLMRDLKRALANADEAVRVAPDYQKAYNARADVYLAAGDFSRAVADYSEALRIDPNYFKTYGYRANTYSLARDYDRAILDYTRAIQINPIFADAYQGRGQAYQAKGDQRRARADFDAARRLRETN